MNLNKFNKFKSNAKEAVNNYYSWLKQNGLFSKNAKNTVRLAFLVTAFTAGILFTSLSIRTENSDDLSNAGSAELAAYRNNLRSQVDDAAGGPRSGRDPANQNQSSLAAVASGPAGVGARTDKPASSVKGDNSIRHKHSDVYGDSKNTGINSAGCYYDYGKQGEQCLSVHITHHGDPTCKDVRRHFPNGIKVSGEDRFNLDKNGDGIACNKGD